MPRVTPHSARPSGHHGASLPPRTGGGGDGRGPGSGDDMPDYGARLRRARMGLAVAMTPILMLFISFTAVYVVRREFLMADMGGIGFVQSWLPVHLPWPFLLVNTIVLLASTLAIDLARRAITRESALAPVRAMPGISLGDERHFPWLALTTALGVAFLAGQLFVWRQLSSAGFHLQGGTSSSFIYILTALHGLHLAGGVVALLWANLAAALHRPVDARRVLVDITSWYWHCMTGLWIYILVLFWLAAD